ncbi:MAG TPA: hypothetical protein EYP57_00205 [Thermodesulfobacteriaceae bacterium]|nr:hypothetical protein [Thermodesulfobacteriaceae bacterium]
MVPEVRPLFVLFTGDFTSGDGTSASRWQKWLDDWSTLTMTYDGRMFPLLPVHGNHENGDFEVLFKLFGVGNQDPLQDRNYTFYACSVGGDLLRIVVLNSCLVIENRAGVAIKQTEWLEEEFAVGRDHVFRIAAWHKAIRRHTRKKPEKYCLDTRGKLFYRFGFDIGCEADSHVRKITYPIRPCSSDAGGNSDNGCFQGYERFDSNGTMYIGEGAWGPRTRPVDDDKP